MAFKMKYKNLEGVVGELRNAVKAHGNVVLSLLEDISVLR